MAGPEVSNLLKAAAASSDDVALAAMRSMKGVAEEKLDPVERAENFMFSKEFQIPLIGMTMGLGPLAGLLEKLKMPWLANRVAAVQNTTFSDAGKLVPGLGKVAGGVSDLTMRGVGLALKPLEAIGLTNIPAAYYARQAAKSEFAIQNALGVLRGHMPNVTQPELRALLGSVDSHVVAGLHTGSFAPELEKSLAGVSEKLGAMGHSAGWLAGLMGGSGSPAGKQIAGAVDTLQKQTNNATLARELEYGYTNLSKVAGSATPHMAKANLWHGLMQGTFIVGAAASDYHTIKDLGKGLHALKDMYAGLTGVKEEDISLFKLFLGKVPAPVAAARSELIKEFGPAAVMDAANTIYNIKIVASPKSLNFLVLMGLAMAGPMIARGLLGGSLLPAYMKIKEAQAAHQPVAQDDYLKLIGNASPELHKLGGENSNFSKALAFFYEQHQASADTVMKEIENGTLKQRMGEMEKAYNAHLQAHPEDAPAREPSRSGRPERKVVGPHTERLHRAAEVSRESPVI